jgi:hypothetical protein
MFSPNGIVDGFGYKTPEIKIVTSLINKKGRQAGTKDKV